jgi:hypothetical protein
MEYCKLSVIYLKRFESPKNMNIIYTIYMPTLERHNSVQFLYLMIFDKLTK